MSSLFRLVDPIGELVIDGDTIGYLKCMLGDLPPDRYQVDERSAGSPEGRCSRCSGEGGLLRKLPDGTIYEAPDLWE
jgi:hypothetical protein